MCAEGRYLAHYYNNVLCQAHRRIIVNEIGCLLCVAPIIPPEVPAGE